MNKSNIALLTILIGLLILTCPASADGVVHTWDTTENTYMYMTISGDLSSSWGTMRIAEPPFLYDRPLFLNYHSYENEETRYLTGSRYDDRTGKFVTNTISIPVDNAPPDLHFIFSAKSYNYKSLVWDGSTWRTLYSYPAGGILNPISYQTVTNPGYSCYIGFGNSIPENIDEMPKAPPLEASFIASNNVGYAPLETNLIFNGGGDPDEFVWSFRKSGENWFTPFAWSENAVFYWNIPDTKFDIRLDIFRGDETDSVTMLNAITVNPIHSATGMKIFSNYYTLPSGGTIQLTLSDIPLDTEYIGLTRNGNPVTFSGGIFPPGSTVGITIPNEPGFHTITAKAYNTSTLLDEASTSILVGTLEEIWMPGDPIPPGWIPDPSDPINNPPTPPSDTPPPPTLTPTPTPKPDVTLTIITLSEETNLPIENALVWIDGAGESKSTNSNGEASFTMPYSQNLKTIIINADDLGYQWFSSTVLPDSSKTITYKLGQKGELPPPTNNTVYVKFVVKDITSTTHIPIQGAKVRFGHAVQVPYGGEEKYTDANGEAIFAASPLTDYNFVVTKAGFITRSEYITTLEENFQISVGMEQGEGYLPPLRNRPDPFPYQDSPILGDIGTQYANMIDSWFLNLQSITDQVLQIGIEPINNAEEAINSTLNSISDSAESTTSTAGFSVVLQMFSTFLGAIPPIIINLVSLVLASDIVIMLLNRPIS